MNDRRELRILSRSECIDLLGTAVIGRVILTAHALPTAMPVSYGLDAETIVFCSAEGVKLSAAKEGTVVAFEVDDFDPALRIGWSVLVTGIARLVSDPAEVRRAERLGIPPWVSMSDEFGYVRVEIGSVSGRRVLPVAHSPAAVPLA